MTAGRIVANLLSCVCKSVPGAGRIVEQGPPTQIFDAPTTQRTRDFLGHLGWSG